MLRGRIPLNVLCVGTLMAALLSGQACRSPLTGDGTAGAGDGGPGALSVRFLATITSNDAACRLAELRTNPAGQVFGAQIESRVSDSIDFGPDGLLYRASAWGLTSITPANGSTRFLGALRYGAGVVHDMEHITFSPTGSLYGLETTPISESEGNEYILYSIDPGNGVTVKSASLRGPLIAGIEWASDGTVYAVGVDSLGPRGYVLMTIDPSDGQITFGASLDVDFLVVEDLDCAADGYIYATGSRSYTAESTQLYRIDPTNGHTELVAEYETELAGLASLSESASASLEGMHDPEDWEIMDSGTTAHLWDVWGSGPKDVFAVGYNGTILHYDGQRWSPMESGTRVNLFNVWGSGPEDVFAAGGYTVLHYNGEQWSQMDGPHIEVGGIWGTGPDDVFAVGAESAGVDPAVAHFDGTNWSRVDDPLFEELHFGLSAVGGAASNDVVAAGAWGKLLHYNGYTWSQMVSSGVGDYSSVWSVGDGYYLIGADGYIAQWNGSYLTELVHIDSLIYKIWGVDSSHFYTAGPLMYYDGSAWWLMHPSEPSATSVWGSGPSDVFAVGLDGKILQYSIDP